MSIYAKIAKVMSQVNRIPKNGYNSFHKYHYATESDLADSIRPILVEHGLAFFSSVIDQEREGEFTKVKMEFVLADTETGEVLRSFYWGEGQDKGDKGLYKAYTGATKYFLMKTFLIPTGDDPEADTHVDERNSGEKPPTLPRGSKQITAKQVGEIKTKILELKRLGAEESAVLDSLRVKVGDFGELTDMTSKQANQALEWLDAWVKKKQGATA